MPPVTRRCVATAVSSCAGSISDSRNLRSQVDELTRGIRVALAVVLAAILLAGCGKDAKVTDKVSEQSGIPLCSKVLSGEATLPADNKCIDDQP